jgi:hypothetical protein
VLLSHLLQEADLREVWHVQEWLPVLERALPQAPGQVPGAELVQGQLESGLWPEQ